MLVSHQDLMAFLLNSTMRWLLLILLCSNAMLAQDIAKYQWKNRVIIVFGNGDNDPRVNEQIQALKSYSNEISEREIIILLPQNSGERMGLMKRLDLNQDFTGLILIGKDGSIKLQEDLIVEPLTLFSLIDTMPMRRAEIRKKSKKTG